MQDTTDRKLCFVIGPMGSGRLDVLKRFAAEVVTPIVAPHGFDVETPDHANVGSVMDQVLLSLEQAELLIADLTGNNPNVLYELAIYHTTGRPCVTVRDASVPETREEETPFDIRAYRYLDLPFDDVKAARAQLEPTLTSIFKETDPRSWYSNPVTDFYHSPLTHLRYASAMAENYVRNFVTKVLHGMFESREKIRVADIEIADDEPVRVEIILPKNLNHARHEYLKKELVEQGRLVSASVRYASRTFSLYAYPEPTPDGVWRLVDVPTILATIRDSVQQRMGPRGRMKQVDKAERTRLERAEVRRFRDEIEAELVLLRERHFYKENQVQLVYGNPFEATDGEVEAVT